VLEVKNASLSKVTQALGGAPFFCLDQEQQTNRLKNVYSNPALKGSAVTAFTYKPLVGMTSATDANGQTIYYVYDAFGRLIESYRMDNGVKRVLESYKYHYQNQ
jgi:YD repeat-containing protein